MIDERSALLKGIIENPEDTLRRKVYADHIEEHHRSSIDCEQAEFIRLSCELQRIESLSKEKRAGEGCTLESYSEQVVRYYTLLRGHGSTWFGGNLFPDKDMIRDQIEQLRLLGGLYSPDFYTTKTLLSSFSLVTMSDGRERSCLAPVTNPISAKNLEAIRLQSGTFGFSIDRGFIGVLHSHYRMFENIINTSSHELSLFRIDSVPSTGEGQLTIDGQERDRLLISLYSILPSLKKMTNQLIGNNPVFINVVDKKPVKVNVEYPPYSRVLRGRIGAEGPECYIWTFGPNPVYYPYGATNSPMNYDAECVIPFSMLYQVISNNPNNLAYNSGYRQPIAAFRTWEDAMTALSDAIKYLINATRLF